jgi:hypothetical protein
VFFSSNTKWVLLQPGCVAPQKYEWHSQAGDASVKAAVAGVSCSDGKGMAPSEESSPCKYVALELK